MNDRNVLIQEFQVKMYFMANYTVYTCCIQNERRPKGPVKLCVTSEANHRSVRRGSNKS